MKKILYVEDNEMNRDMLGRRLTRRDYEVIFAFDGQEGLDKMKSESPDLVLMDMGLPVLDGWDATTQAKACLLYTSPSPRDLAVSRMPSSA